MNWIRTSPTRPGEHASLPAALVSSTLLPSARHILRVHSFCGSYWNNVFLSAGAELLYRRSSTDHFCWDMSNLFLAYAAFFFLRKRARWFREKAAKCRGLFFSSLSVSLSFCRCPAGNRWALGSVLTPESAGCVMLMVSFCRLCLLHRIHDSAS